MNDTITIKGFVATDPTHASLDIFGHDRADARAHLTRLPLDHIKGSVTVAIIATEVENDVAEAYN